MEAIYRATCRGQVTKLCNSITDYLKAVDFSSMEDPRKIEQEITLYLDRIKNAHANMRSADEAVAPSIKEEDQRKECESVIEYDDKAISVISTLEHLLRSKFRTDHHQQQLANAEDRHNTSSHSHGGCGSFQGVKLKSFELKRFNGDFENWIPFWEQFKKAVHENANFNSATKFNFLSESLTGKAAATISGFTPTEKCYNDAISLLMEEYGNTEKIVEKYLQKMMSIKAVYSPTDAGRLRYLYNETSATMRSLTALEVPSSQYNIVLRSILLQALPTQLRVNFHRSLKKTASSSSVVNNSGSSQESNSENDVDGDDRLTDLISFLKCEVEALEISHLSERADQTSHKAKNHHKFQCKPRVSPSTAMGLLTHAQNPSVEKCCFCKSSAHTTKNCNSDLSLKTKKNILLQEGRCFRCTKLNHSSKFCKNQWLKCDICNGRHLTSMCEKRETNTKPSDANYSDKETSTTALITSEDDTTNDSVALNTICQPTIFLQTAKAILCAPQNKSKCFLTRLIMDNGSQRTYVTKELSAKLNLPVVGIQRVRIIPFGEHKESHAKKCKQIEIAIRSQFSNTVINITAIEVPQICADVLPAPTSDTCSKLKHLKLADTIACTEKLLSGINLLIGQDNYWKFNTVESELLADDCAAVNTFFGWTLQGRGQVDHSINQGVNINTFLVTEKYSFENKFDITKFWQLEQIGISNSENSEDTLERVVSNITLNKDKRYEVSLPWKLDSELNNNKSVALARLRGLTNKLIKNNDQMQHYDNGIRELLKLGIAEEAIDSAESRKLYYMPHKPVYREDKSTSKLRIVFDASSSEPGLTSLNEHLYAGDNLIPDILSTILSFRSNYIAIISDIEKAFLQISLSKQDRDTHRFLWYETAPAQYKKLPEVKEFRMNRVTFGVTSSPYLLAATIRKHLEISQSKYGAVCDKLRKSFYIDDLILSVDDIEDAKELFYKSKAVMSEANMNLRKWNSNDLELRKTFMSVGLEPSIEQKVLGIVWNTGSDEIRVDIISNLELLRSLRGTKRNVMRAMAKIYDPLGILGPFTVRIKILLQEIWKANPEWDDNLSDNLLASWQVWQDELIDLDTISIQRCVSGKRFKGDGVERQLHVFADASPKAYGAVAYIRNKTKDHSISVSFVCSKNRVCPITKTNDSELTLPKLELTAAVIAARLSKFLLRSLDFNIDSIHLWTDSTITLNWIMGGVGKIKPYITNRVSEINKHSNIYEWGHCSGKENPADLLTRGISAKLLKNSKLWENGPKWLADDISNWPEKSNNASSLALKVHCEQNQNLERIEGMLTPLLEIENYSSLNRVLRITAYAVKFTRRLKRVYIGNVDITALELLEAEEYWIKYCQQKYFQQEICSLSNNEAISKHSTIMTLNPILVDGILRVKGRLPESEFNFTTRHPIILPKESWFSRLLILDAHRKTLHGGTSIVLAHIRQKFWIVRGRQLIKSILSGCVICKRLHGKSANEPWAALPRERVMTSRPFETVGVDFAGPLYIKCPSSGDTNKSKVYIMLLTCAAIRAIHLELVPDLTVKSCINGLRRFFSRRGVPKTIISDNAKTFKRADLELKKLEELLKSSDVQSLAANSGINWKYIPERAAWWGGFWERLVRSIKDPLKSVIGKASLDFEELRTVLSEVEAVVNSRPLTYITNDPNDLQPLTPSHFLNHSNSILFADFKSDESIIANSWKFRQCVLKRYMKRWRDDYLNQLRTIHHYRNTAPRSLKPGDVVLVHEDGKPRLQWKLAVVQTVFQGRDGKARACQVRLPNQQLLRRPVQLLFPLEISSSIPGAQDEEIY